MNTNISNKRARRFVPWTGLFVLSLLAAIVLAAPTVVFAQITGELSQECDFALIGNTHTITATVTENGAPGTGMTVYFYSGAPYNYGLANFDENGVASFDYMDPSVEPVVIFLYAMDSSYNLITLDSITTNWTDNDQDAGLLSCMDSSSETGSEGVVVGGLVTLNGKKRGSFRIALCSADGLDVTNVERKSVRLVGVAPWGSQYKDSALCPSGKDGVRDLVLYFKTHKVVQALEVSPGELADGDPVTLTLTGSLKDGTTFAEEWQAEIKKERKMHWEKNHHQKECKSVKKSKK